MSEWHMFFVYLFSVAVYWVYVGFLFYPYWTGRTAPVRLVKALALASIISLTGGAIILLANGEYWYVAVCAIALASPIWFLYDRHKESKQ